MTKIEAERQKLETKGGQSQKRCRDLLSEGTHTGIVHGSYLLQYITDRYYKRGLKIQSPLLSLRVKANLVVSDLFSTNRAVHFESLLLPHYLQQQYK